MRQQSVTLRNDADGHAADAVRDQCLALLGKVVSYEHSRLIADAVLRAALLDPLHVVPHRA